ncbi:hypothetical protein ACSLFT_34465 (plasmid) [Streptomyces sp. G6]|uniref:hypothetical protein n=1 Tax=Streptomyces sp. G6 TaxID=1178736 RepID=UPI003ED94425
MTDSMPPEDGKTISFSEKAKSWCGKNKPKIRVALGVTLTVGLAVFAHLQERADAERYDAKDVKDPESFAAREAIQEPRQSLLDPDRDPFLRKLFSGHHASEEANARYRERWGCDLPPGYTYVRRWFYPSQDGEFDAPGEVAA